MRWLFVLVALATSSAAADPAAHDPMPAEEHTGPGSASTKTPDLETLTNDPVLGKAARVNGDEQRGIVAFTFDDGPNPETTPLVIDALEKYDVPATFFIVTQRLLGKHGEKPRELLQRELAAGFTVGSHSVTHPNLKHAAGAQITKEIDNSFRTLAPAAGRPIGLFRPPYGALSGAGRVRLKQLGVTEVIWSVDTLDWKAKNAERLRKKVLKMILAQDGGIVLMHDVKPITAKIIADVLDDLEAENCARLADKREPIIPVSIHYFLRDGKQARAVPEAVQQRTDAYRLALPVRCANRLAHDPNPAKSAAVHGNDGAVCVNNPLAKGCN